MSDCQGDVELLKLLNMESYCAQRDYGMEAERAASLLCVDQYEAEKFYKLRKSEYYNKHRMFCPPDELEELAKDLNEEDARRVIEARREIEYFRKLLDIE